MKKTQKSYNWVLLCKICFVSDHTLSRKGIFTPNGQRKMGGNTFQNIRWNFMMEFLKLALSMSSIKYVVDKLNNRFTVYCHFMLADFLSQGMNFACLPILLMKVTYEISYLIILFFGLFINQFPVKEDILLLKLCKLWNTSVIHSLI